MSPAQPSILVVEDDNGLGRLITISLTSEGWRVTLASTAQFGEAAPAEGHYDGILVDVQSFDPGTIDQLTRASDNGKRPFVILTDIDREDQLLDLMSSRCFDILQKPFSPEDLESCVGLACGLITRPTSDLKGADIRLAEIGEKLGQDPGNRLSLSEWRLLEVLASRPREPVLYQELLGRVWGPLFRNYRQFLSAWIERLATKIEVDSHLGIGYSLR
jgi:two-component system KDP operon response regulator KdpE